MKAVEISDAKRRGGAEIGSNGGEGRRWGRLIRRRENILKSGERLIWRRRRGARPVGGRLGGGL